MIAVTGASGHFGKIAIKELLKEGVKPQDIVAFVRDTKKGEEFAKEGIQLRVADYNDPSTLEAALKGIDKLLFISGSEVGQRYRQHKAVIEAAKKNHVKFIAYTSILTADRSPLSLAEEHSKTEEELKNSGIDYAILRNGWYTENYLMGISHALESGKIYGCAGDARISAATRTDYAQAAVKILLTKASGKNIYELAGDNSFTLTEFAQTLTRLSGKPVNYVNLKEEEYAHLLNQAGLPVGFANMLAETESKAQKGWLEFKEPTISRIIGHQTTPLDEAIRASL